MIFRVAAITAGVFAYIFANEPAAASSWLPSWLGEAFNPPSPATTSVEEERTKVLRAAINKTAKPKMKRTRDAKKRNRTKWAARSRTAAHETRRKREQSSRTNGLAPASARRSTDRFIAAPQAIIVEPVPEIVMPVSRVSDVSNEVGVGRESAETTSELELVADTMQLMRTFSLPAGAETVGQREISPEPSQPTKPQASWWRRIWVAVLGSASGSPRWHKITEEVPACRSRETIERFMAIEGSDEKAERGRADILRRPLLLGDCHILPINMKVTFNEDRLSGPVVCIRTKRMTECFWTPRRGIEQREMASR
jgi:hypothetical protein